MYIACDKSSSNCPLPDSIKDFNFEKIPILQENVEFLKNKFFKFKKDLKSTPVGLEIVNVADTLFLYYDESAQIFVNQILPEIAKNLNYGIEKVQIGWEWMLETGIPWLRAQVAIGSKFLRKLFNEYYPIEFINQAHQVLSERFDSIYRAIYNLKFVQDVFENEKIMTTYSKIMDYTADLREVISKNLGLWFVEYPVVGFDYFWRVLEDDVSGEEYEKLFRSIRGIFPL